MSRINKPGSAKNLQCPGQTNGTGTFFAWRLIQPIFWSGASHKPEPHHHALVLKYRISKSHSLQTIIYSQNFHGHIDLQHLHSLQIYRVSLHLNCRFARLAQCFDRLTLSSIDQCSGRQQSSANSCS